MTKKFLPRASFVPLHDLREAFIENGTSQTVGSSKCGPRMKKACPLFGFLTLLVGAGLIGFSFTHIRQGQVGYKNTDMICNGTVDCIVKYYLPGIYFSFFATKNPINVVSLSDSTLSIGSLSTKNAVNVFRFAQIQTKIVNVNTYLASLIKFKDEHTLKAMLIEELKLFVTNELNRNVEPSSIKYTAYGLECRNVTFVQGI